MFEGPQRSRTLCNGDSLPIHLFICLSLPPSFHPLCMEFLLHPGLFYGLKIRHVGERGQQKGAQLGETVGSGSRWRKRLRGSDATLQAETAITTTLYSRMKLHLNPHMVN